MVPPLTLSPLPEPQALPEEAFADWYCPACEQQLNRESTWLTHQNVDLHLSAAQVKLIALTGPSHYPGTCDLGLSVYSDQQKFSFR